VAAGGSIGHARRHLWARDRRHGLYRAVRRDDAVFLGAALFISSDTALAAEKFLVGAAAPLGRLLRNFVWATYYSAQLVFTLAVAGLPSA